MSGSTASWTVRGVPRGAVVAASAALGVAALCLIVFSTSQRQLQLGVLLGLWSALLGACVIVATRHGESDQVSEAAVRRESELELVASLRREAEQVLSEQLASVREEVAALRAEVVPALRAEVVAALRAEVVDKLDVVHAELVEFPPPAVDLAEKESAAERQQAGRRRAPEPERSNDRYQGRRRADGDPAGRFARADS